MGEGGNRTQKRPAGGDGRPRRCIVHIGLNKTGTTTIQGWLARNAAALEAQGIRYDSFEDGSGRLMHHAVGFPAIAAHRTGRLMPSQDALDHFRVTTMEDQARLVAAFEAAVDESMARPGYRTYVISSEFLPAWLGRPEWSQVFHDWLSERFDRIRYVVYLRDQVDWVPSSYAQNIKTGGTAPIEEFLEQRGTRNYFMICNKWIKGVGRGRLDVRLLEPDFLTGGDLVADFAGVIGARLEGTEPPEILNESLTEDAVQAVRKFNLMVEKVPGNWTREMRGGQIARLIASGTGGKLRLTPEQALDVARRNADSNERLRQRFFKDRPVLFPKAHRVLTEAGEPAGPETRT